MGAGVLTKAPFAISAASKLLAGHGTQYIVLVDDLGAQVANLQKSGKTSKEIAE